MNIYSLCYRSEKIKIRDEEVSNCFAENEEKAFERFKEQWLEGLNEFFFEYVLDKEDENKSLLVFLIEPNEEWWANSTAQFSIKYDEEKPESFVNQEYRCDDF